MRSLEHKHNYFLISVRDLELSCLLLAAYTHYRCVCGALIDINQIVIIACKGMPSRHAVKSTFTHKKIGMENGFSRKKNTSGRENFLFIEYIKYSKIKKKH